MKNKEKNKELTQENEQENEPVNTSEASVTDETEQLKNELLSAHDALLRTAAEYDNFRKRTAREKQQIATDIKAMSATYFFPVLDNIERARNVDENTSVSDVIKGVDMILDQILGAFEKLGVTEISETGVEFNPELHHAVSHVEDENAGENTVVAVFQKGYSVDGKVIRPAMVQVAN